MSQQGMNHSLRWGEKHARTHMHSHTCTLTCAQCSPPPLEVPLLFSLHPCSTLHTPREAADDGMHPDAASVSMDASAHPSEGGEQSDQSPGSSEEGYPGYGAAEGTVGLMATLTSCLAHDELQDEEGSDEGAGERNGDGDNGGAPVRQQGSGRLGPGGASQVTPLRLEETMAASVSGGASAAADSGADAGTPKQPDSPPGRPRETTYPRLLPPVPPSKALPALLSALRFKVLEAVALNSRAQKAYGMEEEVMDVAAAAGRGGELAGGAYGDGPLLAAAAAVELLSLHRCYMRVDAMSYLALWLRYDQIRREGRQAEIAQEEEQLRQLEDAAAEEDGAAAKAVEVARAKRVAAAADAAAAEALVAANARAQRVWQLATVAVGPSAAPIAPGEACGGGTVSFAVLGTEALVDCEQNLDGLARLPACKAPMLFSEAPSRFSSAAADAERRRAVVHKRPAAAPAKAGLVDASRAARAVARFLEVAPPSAYSQSVREARSEVFSQIGSVSKECICSSKAGTQAPQGHFAVSFWGLRCTARVLLFADFPLFGFLTEGLPVCPSMCNRLLPCMLALLQQSRLLSAIRPSLPSAPPQSAASDIVRANDKYQLAPGLLASDLRHASGADDQSPASWSAQGAGQLLLAGKAAAGHRRAPAAAPEVSVAAAGGGGGTGGMTGGAMGAGSPSSGRLGSRGRALFELLAGVRRNM